MLADMDMHLPNDMNHIEENSYFTVPLTNLYFTTNLSSTWSNLCVVGFGGIITVTYSLDIGASMRSL